MVMVVKRKGSQQKFNPNKLRLAVERAVREGYQRKHKLVYQNMPIPKRSFP